MWHEDSLFYWKVVSILACFKSLLIPAYQSTDFEVHRNWLAITHSLPLSEWYKTNISQWTLDYPPLFAWMEKVLSYPAGLFDPKMLEVENLEYTSQATVAFQRLSVIITELVYLYSVFSFMNLFKKTKNNSKRDCHKALALMFLTNFGLFLVDHIHFQYNGVLFGIFLLSILKIYQGKYVECSFWFSILLCMKHIFLYVAPVYGIFLFKKCIAMEKEKKFRLDTFLWKLSSLGLVVLLVLSATFFPFILLGQTSDLLSRLFPFKRGLCHAYWAPNFWAVYNIVDKMSSVIAGQSQAQASMTGGLVQEFDHAYLPSIKPLHTFVITIIFMLPALKIAWMQKQGEESFVRGVVLCAFTSFMFGWHVHEKAVLVILVPLTLLIFNSKEDAKNFLFLSFVANFSLLPLVFTQQETLMKYGLCFLSLHLSFHLTSSYYEENRKGFRLPLMTGLESLYLIGLLFIETYCSLLHTLLFGSVLPFLPLLLTSFYCSVGVSYVYVRMLLFYE